MQAIGIQLCNNYTVKQANLPLVPRDIAKRKPDFIRCYCDDALCFLRLKTAFKQNSGRLFSLQIRFAIAFQISRSVAQILRHNITG